MNRYFPTKSDQVPWTVAVLSLLPLILCGPGRIIVFYISRYGQSREAGYYIPYLALCILVAFICFVLGSVKRFPRWSYIYAFTLTFALTDLINTASYRYGWWTAGPGSFFLFLAVILLTLCHPALRSFYRNIQQDWTLLSFSLFGVVLYFLSSFDRDEYPVLSLGVLLPSLIGLGAVLAYLRIHQASVRVGVLLAGTFAGLFFALIGIFTGMISLAIGIVIGAFMLLIYGTLLAAILLSPLLVIGIWRLLAGYKK